MEMIRSPHNHQIKQYKNLNKRKVRNELGLLPLEGSRLVADTIERGIFPEVVMIRAGMTMADFPFLHSVSGKMAILTVEEKVFDKTAFTESPQGILAVVKKPFHTLEAVFIKQPTFILIADGVQDPGNMGTMLRSAAAAKASGAVLLPQTVDPANPKALRASMGTYFTLPVVETTSADLLREIRARKVHLVTAQARADLQYDQFDWTQPVAVVVGNEGRGVSAEVRMEADIAVSIPMAETVESLNAAVAASILFFEAARQRRILSK